MYQEGNHTPSTKPILPERVTLPSWNKIPNPDFVRYTLKTTDVPSDVRYNAPVGYYIQLHHNTEGPLDNEGLIRNSQALVRKTQEGPLYLHPCLGSDTYEDFWGVKMKILVFRSEIHDY